MSEQRLIDANSLLEDDSGLWDIAVNIYGELYVRMYDLTNFIEKRPTIKAEPVRHGEWRWNPNGLDWGLGAWVCSKCGCKNGNLPNTDDLNPYIFAGSKYCPNCGAKMDGGE